MYHEEHIMPVVTLNLKLVWFNSLTEQFNRI